MVKIDRKSKMSVSAMNWLKRRSTPDSGSMRIARNHRLQRKLINIGQRIAIFCMGILYRKYRNPEKPNLENTSSILIIPHDPIGDLVITSALWNMLKTRYPHIRVGVVCSERNRDVLQHEQIDKIYDLYSSNIFRFFNQMLIARRDSWEVVLSTAGFYKPTRFAFISRFIAHKSITASMHSSRSQRYARIYSFCFPRPTEEKQTPMVEQYQALVEKVFDITFTAKERLPHFTIDKKSKTETEHRITNLLHEKGYSRYILINLEAKVPYREWGIENVRVFAETLYPADRETMILLSASAKFLEYYQPRKFFEKNLNVEMFPTKNIHELASVIECAAIVISPDTAVVHIAATLRKKIIAFYPSPDEWLPYGIKTTIFYPERWEPISTINVTKVFSAAVSLLEP